MRTLPLFVLVSLLLAGCKHDPGSYISVDDFNEAAQPSDAEYVIRVGDVVNVRVFQQEPMSARTRVRADGKISLPFLNDVVAAGFTPVVLGAQLQARLKDFINNPVVTVFLEETRQLTVSVLGEVPHAGIFTLDPGVGVLQALAAAGGFTNFAQRDIYVMRANPSGGKPQRIRFDYEKLSHADGKAAAFALKTSDVVIVE